MSSAACTQTLLPYLHDTLEGDPPQQKHTLPATCSGGLPVLHQGGVNSHDNDAHSSRRVRRCSAHRSTQWGLHTALLGLVGPAPTVSGATKKDSLGLNRVVEPNSKVILIGGRIELPPMAGWFIKQTSDWLYRYSTQDERMIERNDDDDDDYDYKTIVPASINSNNYNYYY
mmetsp:Transcript_12517/g.14318  ORF Transcript_12517/g.14318 Transcript_12517/m.14318 type:complete len:171 (+) Transcript_12517:31-543(+)